MDALSAPLQEGITRKIKDVIICRRDLLEIVFTKKRIKEDARA